MRCGRSWKGCALCVCGRWAWVWGLKGVRDVKVKPDTERWREGAGGGVVVVHRYEHSRLSFCR